MPRCAHALLLVGFLLPGFLLAAAVAAAQPTPVPPSDAQVEARVNGLLGRMTLEDKVGSDSSATLHADLAVVR